MKTDRRRPASIPWTSALTLSCEQIFPDSLLPIPKNAGELQPHKRIRQFTQWPVWQRVLHLIVNDGDAILLPKAMGMDPAFVGAPQLDIDKLLWRVPALNLTLPGEGDAKEMQAVLDTRPLTEMDGLRCHHLKPKFWWRNALQIGGLSKERKDFVTWEWKRHRGGNVCSLGIGSCSMVESITRLPDAAASGGHRLHPVEYYLMRDHGTTQVTHCKSQVVRHMAQSFDATYPTIVRWVQEYGWIEIGQDDMSRSFIRALDDGGTVWEGRKSYPTLDAALQASRLGWWYGCESRGCEEPVGGIL